MIRGTTFAGNGPIYVILRQWTGHSYPTAEAHIIGSHSRVGDGLLGFDNGDHEIVLDLDSFEEPERQRDDEAGFRAFSAIALTAPKKFDGFVPGKRVEILVAPLASVVRLDPDAVTQRVLHTKRDLHGPGPYPEDTKWGSWINSYRRKA